MFLTVTVSLADERFDYDKPKAEATMYIELPMNVVDISLGNLVENMYVGTYESVLKQREEEG